jgi:predicted lactoylglutathione lyase
MTKMIFVNLPVEDVSRSIAFYEALGAQKNPNFSSDDTACMVLSEAIHVMAMERPRFQTFTTRPIPDAHATTGMLLAIMADSRDAVDATIAAGAGAGGGADPTPKQDLGFMYSRSVEDPDGHIWEVGWMDMAGMAEAGHGAAGA